MFSQALLLALMFISSVSCSTFQKSPVPDLPSEGFVVSNVGVVGPYGEVLTFSREDKFILVKSCKANSVFGEEPQKVFKNCEGKINKVPVEIFRLKLRSLVSPVDPNSIKPSDLEKINNFISVYGPRDDSGETKVHAIEELDFEIDRAVHYMTIHTRHALENMSVDRSQVLYKALKNFDPNIHFPCGLKGSVEERIEDCSFSQSVTGLSEFVLVTRTKDMHEIYKETGTGYLWTSSLIGGWSFDHSVKACQSNVSKIFGRMGVDWDLPSINDLKEADRNGIKNVFSDMIFYKFWTSTPNSIDPSKGLALSGRSVSGFSMPKDNYHSVKCVAK